MFKNDFFLWVITLIYKQCLCVIVLLALLNCLSKQETITGLIDNNTINSQQLHKNTAIALLSSIIVTTFNLTSLIFIIFNKSCEVKKTTHFSLINIDLCARPPIAITLFTFKAKRKGSQSVNKTYQQIDASTLH